MWGWLFGMVCVICFTAIIITTTISGSNNNKD